MPSSLILWNGKTWKRKCVNGIWRFEYLFRCFFYFFWHAHPSNLWNNAIRQPKYVAYLLPFRMGTIRMWMRVQLKMRTNYITKHIKYTYTNVDKMRNVHNAAQHSLARMRNENSVTLMLHSYANAIAYRHRYWHCTKMAGSQARRECFNVN